MNEIKEVILQYRYTGYEMEWAVAGVYQNASLAARAMKRVAKLATRPVVFRTL